MCGIRWLALVLAICGSVFGCVLSSPAAAEVPRLGVGAGFGEYGTLGAGLRYRPTDRLAFEAGAGAYRYELEDGREEIDGFVPAFGCELVVHALRRKFPMQHGVGVVFQYQEVLGVLLGLGYRYERFFGGSRAGMHLELGMMFAPNGKDRAKSFYEDETGRTSDDLDFNYLPLLLKLGVQF